MNLWIIMKMLGMDGSQTLSPKKAIWITLGIVAFAFGIALMIALLQLIFGGVR